MHTPKSEVGLTLMDVLVAVVIAGIAFGAILQASTIYFNQTSDAWKYSVAEIFGQHKTVLFEVGAEQATSGYLSTSGMLANFDWQVINSVSSQRKTTQVSWEKRGKRVSLQAGSQLSPANW